uniref:Uncharacterized protein n=1 Tax=Anguilla anguilla TaxID=7936 RepID=A0A0E9R8J0_ANGAN
MNLHCQAEYCRGRASVGVVCGPDAVFF